MRLTFGILFSAIIIAMAVCARIAKIPESEWDSLVNCLATTMTAFFTTVS